MGLLVVVETEVISMASGHYAINKTESFRSVTVALIERL